MAKNLELAFTLAGKLEPSFTAAAQTATVQLNGVVKKVKEISAAAQNRMEGHGSENMKSLRARCRRIDGLLERAYPDAGCALEFENPWECLVSTILSAQCTDRKVNQVTPGLFERYPDVERFAEARPGDVEKRIHSLGLFRGKARNIVEAAKIICSKHGGRVPDAIDELIGLPGVGRKTANCVVLNAYGKPGLMCDTHFCRITGRLGLHKLGDPDKIEFAVGGLLRPARWGDFSHRVIAHGRERCGARSPRCGGCPLAGECIFLLERNGT